MNVNRARRGKKKKKPLPIEIQGSLGSGSIMQDDDSSFWTYSIIALPKTKHYLVTAQSYLRPSQTEREFIVNLGKRKHVLLLAPRMDGAFRKWVFMAKMSNT